MKWLSVVLAVLLTGCTMEVSAPTKTKVLAIVEIVDSTKVQGALGTHQEVSKYELLRMIDSVDSYHYIEIRKDVYPKCFNHEFAHAFSGDWHKGYNTTQICD